MDKIETIDFHQVHNPHSSHTPHPSLLTHHPHSSHTPHPSLLTPHTPSSHLTHTHPSLLTPHTPPPLTPHTHSLLTPHTTPLTHSTRATRHHTLHSTHHSHSHSHSHTPSLTPRTLHTPPLTPPLLTHHTQEVDVNGVRFWCYIAGHVLGAAMFMIEIAGVKILYTGDFSCEEDRHLMAAEVPAIRPDILISVSMHAPSVMCSCQYQE